MNPPKHSNHSLHVGLGVLLPLLLLGAGATLLWFAQKPTPPKVPGLGSDPASLLSVMPAAQVQPVLALTEPLDLIATGTVVPFREIVLAAEVAGKVIEKDPSVRHGNHVHKGQSLLTIDPRDYQLDVDRLMQRLEQEKVSLGENEQELANTQRLVELAQAQYALAEADFERTKKLGQNFASESELGSAKQAMLSAMNQRVTLENQMSTLRTRSQRLQLAIRLVETELEQSRLNLERTRIQSPVDGVVVREQVEADSYVQRGSNLITIEDISKAEVACSLRMEQLYWILDQATGSHDRSLNSALASLQKLPKIDAVVQFRVAGRQSVVYEWEGRLDRVEGTGLDPQSRMVPIRVVVDRPGNYRVNGQESPESSMALVRGMFVDVILKAQPATPLLLVPKSSVKPATNSYRIWKFDPDPAALQVVAKRKGLMDTPADGSAAPGQGDALPTLVAERSEGSTASNPDRPDPALWQSGFLRILEGIEVLGSYQNKLADETEYWICDAGGAEIIPGDFVVVTPIPGIDTAEEPIRVSKQNLSSNQEAKPAAVPTHSSAKGGSKADSPGSLQ